MIPAPITATGEEDNCIVLLGSMVLGERAPSLLLVALHSPQDSPNGGIVAPRDGSVSVGTTPATHVLCAAVTPASVSGDRAKLRPPMGEICK